MMVIALMLITAPTRWTTAPVRHTAAAPVRREGASSGRAKTPRNATAAIMPRRS